MNSRIGLSLLVTLSFLQQTQAVFRCESAHTPAVIANEMDLATQLDQLNGAFNRSVFGKSLVEILNEDHSKKPFFQRLKGKKQSEELNLALKQLNQSGNWSKSDFENFARQLEKMSFLEDSTATKNMNLKEKLVHRQLRHSILADGLQNFIFGTKTVAPGVKKRVYDMISRPFKHKWMKWAFVWSHVPQLNGQVIPADLAMKIAWDGVKAHEAELAPYMKTIIGKAMFNGFGAVYNKAIIAAVIAGVYITYNDQQDEMLKAAEEAIAEAQGARQATAKSAKDGHYPEMGADQDLKNSIEVFKEKHGREPTALEIESIKLALQVLVTPEDPAEETESASGSGERVRLVIHNIPDPDAPIVSAETAEKLKKAAQQIEWVVQQSVTE